MKLNISERHIGSQTFRFPGRTTDYARTGYSINITESYRVTYLLIINVAIAKLFVEICKSTVGHIAKGLRFH